MSPQHSRDDYPADADDPAEQYPYVPTEGATTYYGKYKSDVEEVDLENRRAYVDVRTSSVSWEGHVPLYHLADEKHDVDDYPWEDDDEDSSSSSSSSSGSSGSSS